MGACYSRKINLKFEFLKTAGKALKLPILQHVILYPFKFYDPIRRTFLAPGGGGTCTSCTPLSFGPGRL